MNIQRVESFLSNEQKAALDLMLAGENVFLTGEAGTGKSTILREFRKRCDPGQTVFLAPTGIAAINIAGQTIHSFCRLKAGLQSPDTIDEIGDSRYRNLLNAVQTVVIDEISMVRSDVFAAIDHRLREAALDCNRERPFAGKQIIVCGDFFQLPPVTSTDAEEIYMQVRLGGCYPFQSDLWRQVDFQPVLLKEIHRQGNDMLFMEILKNIRRGEVDSRTLTLPGMSAAVNSVVALNKCCYLNAGARVPGREIALCTTRKEAESVNRRYAEKLNSSAGVFKAQITGKFLEKDYPTAANLKIQPGARVMTLTNKRNPDGSYEYLNGSLGTVREIICDEDGLGSVEVEFDDGHSSVVGTEKWTAYKYVVERDLNTGREVIKQIEAGSFTQIPLRLAWAITIHKSQGMGFENVKLFLGNGCFATGQLYTALSRCKSLEGLALDRKIFKDDVLFEADVVDFYRQLESEAS